MSVNPTIKEIYFGDMALLKVPKGLERSYIAETEKTEGIKDCTLNWKVCIPLPGEKCPHEYERGEIISTFETDDKAKMEKIVKNLRPNLLHYNLENDSGIVEVLKGFEPMFIRLYKGKDEVVNAEIYKAKSSKDTPEG